MKFSQLFLSLTLVGCLKQQPPIVQAETIDVPYSSEPAIRLEVWQNQLFKCNMPNVIDLIDERCCPLACRQVGKTIVYDHNAHKQCALEIMYGSFCSPYDIQNTTEVSICACQ